ncbi:hypothetical protein GCM10011492_36040 [Flexivirga endophytica]|uniref:Uncharacterized protein n=1 Tax=Flexivirga endophytica TaxID=1849103 RepID=A0A916TEG1_9MICO|nr:hypothetical protein [Flexivirga endophytica]GGB41868.1 hypothetical protein GCM10011492_36040 [Flexivirga endophytica]GHB69431.1 hypothetical protein GCM10008112_42540 [Flexivirga endophytica]
MPVVTAKKKCCKDSLRCKKCPVTLERLRKAGHAQRMSKRGYDVDADVPGKIRKAARRR